MSEQKAPITVEALKKPQGAERRQWIRYRCNVECSWNLFGKKDADSRKAKVFDVSVTGIGLIVHTCLRRGTLLSLTVQRQNEENPRQLLVRVNHTTGQPDGNWFTGCTFVKVLTDDDLQALI